MADLQCAVRVFVARHGEAEYETDLLVDDGGSLTATGRAQSRALAETLAGERIAHVYASSMARAVQTAEIVAAHLGVEVTVREGLRESSVGSFEGHTGDPDPFRDTFDAWLDGRLDAAIPGGESGDEVVSRFGAVMQEVRDRFPGESVLVVSHGGAICTSVPNLARNVDRRHPVGRPLSNTGVVEVDGDADGWVVRRWAGEPLPT